MPRRIKVKSLDTIKRNYQGAATEAARRYGEAINDIEWHDRAVETHDLWVERITDSSVQNRRKAKLEAVSDSDFKAALKSKGAPVIAQRMRDAADKQASGYRPIRDALENLEIPDKTGDPYANIDNILKPVVRAMREASGKE